ncbi:MFS transporter [Cupriavidus sp. CP313]
MSNSVARAADLSPAESMERVAYAKVTWRLIPLLFVSYVMAFLDRVNVGFAKLQMLSDLSFSEATYGLGAGIFFLGYVLFEVPSNIVQHRVGARRWISRIMITWGLLSASMMFVQTPTTFYVLRFLLGVAEAGFLPGIVLYLTYWYPAHRRGKIMALFFAAVPASGLIGGPVSGWILESLSGAYGFAGWQWLFVLEALPSIVLGMVILLVLPDGIQDASWLSPQEKSLLAANIKVDAHDKHELQLRKIFSDRRVLVMAGIYFCATTGGYGISFWLPSIIKMTGVVSPLKIGLLSAIPFLLAIVGMLFFSRSADARRERKLHLAGAMSIGAFGLVLSVFSGSDTTRALFALSIAAIGVYSAFPVFWSLPTAFLTGIGAAAAIAFITSVGNIGGFVSSYLIGWIKQMSGSTDLAILVLAAIYVVGVLLTLTVPARLVNK